MRHFGLIGYPLGHSFSRGYFSRKFEAEQIDAEYENYPIASIAEFPELIRLNPALEGLNVTIPYKEQVIPFLDELSPVVQVIGACNCIAIRNGKLIGHNTDVIGFENSLAQYLRPEHRKALVFGTGGAAKAVFYVLEKLGIEYKVVSRTAKPENGIISYDDLTPSDLKGHLLWINTTPLGMYPNVESAPAIDYSLIGSSHYLYDLVYNPAETKFLLEGKERGTATRNGYDMLLIQAEESWKIWNQGR
ncbi:shikimate dehydrogenase [Flavihumibacter rivuli]|uniref:shikimate dehydrogenase family protein n=1 Tax=Flavihumibacter rivuli TaxID=2838156 RepID=UPI001BDE4B9A|nr:shikimate dehydrogenase [Flavihumibacter rivuli]ULQ58070.1 shikimate dehydrogenase [Flavihumibacter rivuli]